MSRYRALPRISVTKLAEYLVATAGRRRTILEDQKLPSAFKAAKWTEAYAAIVDVLLHGCDPRRAAQYLEGWRQRVPKSRFEAERLPLWILAMSTFAQHMKRLRLSKYAFAPGVTEAYVDLGGVRLSLRPDVIIAGADPGAFKLYLGKSIPLTKSTKGRPGSGTYAAALLHLWAEPELGAVPKQSLVLDVLRGTLFQAPEKPAARRRDALAACKEIAVVWESILPDEGSAQPCP